MPRSSSSGLLSFRLLLIALGPTLTDEIPRTPPSQIQRVALLSYSMVAVHSGGGLEGHESARWQVFKAETSEKPEVTNIGHPISWTGHG